MARNKKDNRYLAKLVTGKGAPCAFCLREVDDEITFGKLYAIGSIQCHYFCCLLSCCLIQKGHDDEGLFGFMYTDILAEIERCKKHKCSYCSRNGASLGCSVGVCRKQFHLPCGRERNAISLYYGSYKSFCQQHAPRQKIPEHIMAKAKLRIQMRKKNVRESDNTSLKTVSVAVGRTNEGQLSEEMVCVICYEAVDGFPTVNTFWPPCCAKDAWFHRSCLQRMALSAGMHYLKCPLCNDKENFYEAVVSQGYYVPDRDAAWELEQNAFAEIYERPATCCFEKCLCPMGRAHDEETGKWDIKLCILCGSAGAHAQCIADQSQPTRHTTLDQSQAGEINSEPKTCTDQSVKVINEFTQNQSQATNRDGLSLDQSQTSTDGDELSFDQSQKATDREWSSLRYICPSCLPAAPEDLSALVSSIEAIIQQEQSETVSNARRPVMPSRMSLRRTKGRLALNAPSSSRSSNLIKIDNGSSDSPNVQSSRRELNLKTPRKPSTEPTCRGIRSVESKLLSPVKLLEQSFKEKVVCTGVRDAVLDESVIDALRRRFRKPRPLCEKKRIVNDILDGLFDDLVKNSTKQKEQIKEWCSPRKSSNSIEDSNELTAFEASKTPEKDQDKETYSKIYNTPAKHTYTIKADATPTFQNTDTYSKNTDGNETDIKTEEKASKYTEKCRKSSETIDADCNKSIDLIHNFKHTDIEKSSAISKTLLNDFNKSNELVAKTFFESNTIDVTKQTKYKITISPPRNENRRNTRKSMSKTIINYDDSNLTSKNDNVNQIEKETEETSPKNLSRKTRSTRNSSSKTFTDVENSETDTLLYKKFNKLDDKQTIKQKISPLKIVLKNEKLNNKNKPKSKGDKSPKSSVSVKDLQNTENVKNGNSPNEVSYKLLPNETAKSKPKPVSEGFTNQEGCILKKLLTEKDLCSHLLLELTRGKRSEKISVDESPKGLETLNSLIETTKSCINSPNHSLESPTNSLLSPKNSLGSSNNAPESPKNSHGSSNNAPESPKNSHGSSNNAPESPKNSLESSNNAPESPKNSHGSSNNAPEPPKNSLESSNNAPESPKNSHGSSNNASESPKNSLESANNLLTSPNNLIEYSNNLVETPKRKTIDIQQDSSLEISENDQSISIDVIKIEESVLNKDTYKILKINIPEKNKTCAFKFSPRDKETLEKNNVGIDLESFKKEYLNEVDREFTCNFRHKHVEKTCDVVPKLRTAIDFAIDAATEKETGCASDVLVKNSKKRKLSESGVRLLFDNSVKKRKVSESDLKLAYNFDEDKKHEISDDPYESPVEDVKKKKTDKNKGRKDKTKDKRKAKKNKKSTSDKNIEVTIDSSEKKRSKKKKSKKKIKTKFAIQNENIHVRIKWKKKQLSLNIESKKLAKKEKKENSSKFKQYVLQFPEGSSKEVLVKPEKEVCPIKRTRVQQEKSSDNLKQTSIHNFFKMKSPEK